MRLRKPLLAFGIACAGYRTPAAAAQDKTSTAIEHVTVIPMDREHVLADHTVVMQDGHIVSVAPSATAVVPKGARRIDGKGLYAIPGMADMHVHPYDTQGLSSYLAYGITTIAVMHGSLPVLGWRKQISDGTLAGPTIYSASPTVNGFPAGNPVFIAVQDSGAARAVVRDQKAAGYDFIKVYSFLNPVVYAALLDEAHKIGIPVVGHIPWQVGYSGVLREGQANVAHIEEFFQNGDVPDDSMPAIARAVARAGTTVTANLFAYADYLRTIASIDSVLDDPEIRYASPAQYSEKIPTSNRATNRSDLASFAKFLRERRLRFQKLLRAFQDAGVPILVGTDTETFGFPGQSAYLELLQLAEAGLRPFDVLAAGTRSAGEFVAKRLPGASRFGQIAPGMRADIVLLRANPLDDVHNLSRIAGVVVRGQWYSTARLQQMRDTVAATTSSGRRFVVTFDSLMMKAKNAGAAAILLREWQTANPDAVPLAELVWLGYGRMLYSQDKASSIAIRAMAVQAYPSSQSAHNQLARGYLFAGDTTRAIEEFRRSLALAPRNLSVQDMLDQVMAARTPLRFDPVGTFELDSVAMKVKGAVRQERMQLTLRRDSTRLGGQIRFSDSTFAINEVVAGGDRLWVFADAYGQGLELRLHVHATLVEGTWILGWANNGALSGRRTAGNAP